MKELLTMLVPVVVAFLTTLIVQGIKRAVTLVDGTPAIVKQLLAVGVAFVLTKLAAFTGVGLPPALGGLDATVVSALLSSVFAMLIHAGWKTDQAKP